MAIINVSGAAQLAAALNAANAGDTLRLAAGDYGTLNLNGNANSHFKFAADVTITSASASAPAVFRDVTLTAVTNLNFENVDFTGAAGRTGGDLVTISGSRGVTINNSDLEGYQIGGVQAGLSVSSSSDVQISNSELADFYYGASFRKVDNLRVLNNDIHSMDFDGLRFAQVTNTLIQGNRLHDQDGTADGGHRDQIQFWTTETTAPSANVTIRGNTIDIGDGRMIQAIFINNEVASAGANTGMFYRNFLIEGNRIESVHPHGIYVDDIMGLTIRNNVVVKDPTSGAYQPGYQPIIEVSASSSGVSITGNTAHDIPDARPGWAVSGNTLVPLSYVPSGGSPIVAPVSPPVSTPVTSPATPATTPVAPGSTTGNASANTLVGGDGADQLRGYAGNDILRGQGNKDVLIGGTGSDIFDFDVASHSFGIVRDALRGGDGGASFDGAGGAAGDRIDVSTIDANTAVAGNQVFAWGGTGAGQMSAIEMGNTATLIRGNTDADSAFEFELVIEDARTVASAYTSVDFIL